ncbi:FXYD domain-containing ion transport regulator 11-like [Solea senegalensis]|uniref:FXYD domain-containing ion transport regulator n=1 Tax=Solea senegalensis TaxID=28829 RepID=A0AAV6PUS5_SOLSE|nr:FXYD domain-containing ion transport regulator 11-like [Solea senegalensis]
MANNYLDGSSLPFELAVEIAYITVLCTVWDVTEYTPEFVSSVVLKMGHLNFVAMMAVLFTLFVETEANPFVYNYERLRIAGLVFAFLLVIGGFSVLVYHKCTTRRARKVEDDNSEI